MDSIRVLIADDDPRFREGLRALLTSASGMELTGEATTGQEAIQMAQSLQPDVIIMDLNMPEVNGIQATRQIVQMSPHIGVLILTVFVDDHSIFASMRAGARGYLVKGASRAEVLRAIQTVESRGVIFSPAVAMQVMKYFEVMHTSQSMTQPRLFPELSDREREILTLIAEGLANPDIAAQLVISPKTVRNHVSNIFAKLQVADRAEAILRARQEGLG
jgi:DNA-binding NarL/FixJ family response regulator